MYLEIEMTLKDKEGYNRATLAQAKLSTKGAFYKIGTIKTLAQIVAEQLWEELINNSNSEVEKEPEQTMAPEVFPSEQETDVHF